MRTVFVSTLVLSTLLATQVLADDIGCVSTNIRMLGMANDKICITSFRDPEVNGVACYISKAETGGAKGAVGLAEDTSDAAISCHQIGPIALTPDVKDKEQVFKESRSILFKKLHVIRFLDKDNNTLVYLSYSDKLIEGSPKNSISAVPIMPWTTQP